MKLILYCLSLNIIMISLLGMADDLWDLDWMLKLAGQLLISVFVAWGGLQIISYWLIGKLSYRMTVFIKLSVR